MTLPSERARREAGRFLRFAVVGVIGAVVDFGVFNLLTAVFHVWSVAASAISFAAAVISNFTWNRFWTYPDSRAKPIRRQALQFALVNFVGLAIRTPIFAFAEQALLRLASRLQLPGIPEPGQLASNAALALAVVVVLFWNFGINRIWTYSDVS
ncbi:MAG TPA: GtrA family protein [Anaerolineales bacterium]|nr:GtrA family protein [Anaerolineales bacterium]